MLNTWTHGVLSQVTPPSLKQNPWRNDDCLEGKREDYQACSVQYCVQQLCSTLQCTDMNRPNSCLLVRFSFPVVMLYSMMQFICVRFSFLGLFCAIVCVCVLLLCQIQFLLYYTKRLARKNVSEMIFLCQVGRKTLIQSNNQSLTCLIR